LALYICLISGWTAIHRALVKIRVLFNHIPTGSKRASHIEPRGYALRIIKRISFRPSSFLLNVHCLSARRKIRRTMGSGRASASLFDAPVSFSGLLFHTRERYSIAGHSSYGRLYCLYRRKQIMKTSSKSTDLDAYHIMHSTR
jgi:hypothetical protein